jgi:hypothetical protein
MPYKDAESKRRWEQEHREERNARRRRHFAPAREMRSVPEATHDPVQDQHLQLNWQVVVGFAVGLGVVLLAVLIIRRAIQRARKHHRKLETHDLQQPC